MSSETAPSPDGALRLAHAFANFGPAYFKWVQSQFAACGVSFARMRLLAVLHKLGPQIMSSLSDELGVTARNVTALVDALEGDGLVRRVPHATDRRATVVELTEAGARHGCMMADGSHLEMIAALFRDLTEEEQGQMLSIVTKLQGLLARRGFTNGPGGPPPAEGAGA